MPRSVRVTAVAAALLLTFAWSGRVHAQNFDPGSNHVAGVIGFGNIGDAGVSIGGRFERAIKTLPEMGDGVLGIEVSVDWWQYSIDNSVLGDWSWTYIPISGTANYHFQVEGGKWDPFLGAGLGFWIVSADCGNVDCDSNSGLYFVGRAGVRYFFQPAMAVYADLGAGASTINIGASFKVGSSN
jgi:hypothetical protein